MSCFWCNHLRNQLLDQFITIQRQFIAFIKTWIKSLMNWCYRHVKLNTFYWMNKLWLLFVLLYHENNTGQFVNNVQQQTAKRLLGFEYIWKWAINGETPGHYFLLSRTILRTQQFMESNTSRIRCRKQEQSFEAVKSQK